MKMLNLCIALVFSLSVCLIAAPDSGFAASKETTSKVEKTTKKATKSATNASKSSPININTADKKTLTKIPGVGPATADSILKYRKANGKFKSANDLLNVKGIGEKTLKKMKPFLKF